MSGRYRLPSPGLLRALKILHEIVINGTFLESASLGSNRCRGALVLGFWVGVTARTPGLGCSAPKVDISPKCASDAKCFLRAFVEEREAADRRSRAVEIVAFVAICCE